MKPTVYIETSVIGYLAMRLSNLLQVAAKQQMTREWWDDQRGDYDLYVSQFVIDECSAGDPIAAQERLQFLSAIPLLELPAEVDALAKAIIKRVSLPAKASVDAFHIAAASVNGVEYLLTWNCKHIANPSLRRRIDGVCRALGYEPPVICTPQEMLEQDHGI